MNVMTDRGAEIQARRLRLGMDRAPLAKEAEVNVDTLRDIEEGTTKNPRDATVAKILATLDALEEEASLPPGGPVPSVAPAGLMEFEVTGDFGVRVVVKGPVGNAAELEASVARLIRDIRSTGNEAAAGAVDDST